MDFLAGKLLIASPRLMDPNFRQSVTLIVQHDEQGALGLILNRPSQTRMSEAWAQVSPEPCEHNCFVLHGGPCPGPLMILHTHPDRSQIQVLPGICFSTDPEDVQWLVVQGSDPLRFFAGYAGWGPGQLEAEMKTGSWLVAPATEDLVFRHSPRLWLDLMHSVSRELAPPINPRVIPPDPSVN